MYLHHVKYWNYFLKNKQNKTVEKCTSFKCSQGLGCILQKHISLKYTLREQTQWQTLLQTQVNVADAISPSKWSCGSRKFFLSLACLACRFFIFFLMFWRISASWAFWRATSRILILFISSAPLCKKEETLPDQVPRGDINQIYMPWSLLVLLLGMIGASMATWQDWEYRLPRRLKMLLWGKSWDSMKSWKEISQSTMAEAWLRCTWTPACSVPPALTQRVWSSGCCRCDAAAGGRRSRWRPRWGRCCPPRWCRSPRLKQSSSLTCFSHLIRQV